MSVPATKGELGILPRRAPIMSTLSQGVVRVKKEEKSDARVFAVAGGYVENDGFKVVVLADRAEALDKHDLEAVRQAKAENEKKLAAMGESDSRAAFVKNEISWYTLLEAQLMRGK